MRASLFSAALSANRASPAIAAEAMAGSRATMAAGAVASARAGEPGESPARPVAAQETMLAGRLGEPREIDGEEWLERVRGLIEEPGEYLAFEQDGELELVGLTREWTRIGRSLAADVRFDDPTVSRRHALVVRQADGVRILDDRSLNGVFVNGARIEWKVLRDGDEILVGRYRLRFLSVAGGEGAGNPGGVEAHSG